MAKANNRLPKLVDRAGRLRSHMAEMKEELDSIESELKDSKLDEIDGKHYRSTISRFKRGKTDWKTIAEELGTTKKMIRKYTKNQTITRLKITARLV